MDSFCVEDFSDKGLLDDMDNRIEKTNLSILLTNCSDFADEESLLQLNIRLLGAVCIHSPKYHCEIAGEGIEYSWGNSKAKYRRIKVKDKKQQSNSEIRLENVYHETTWMQRGYERIHGEQESTW